MAYGILDLCTGLGAQWFRVTEKYVAAGKQREYTPLGLAAWIIMWPGNPLSFMPLPPFDLCDRFSQTQSSRYGEKKYQSAIRRSWH